MVDYGPTTPPDSNDNTISAIIRVLFALIVCGLVVAYTVGVVTGRVSENQQIDAVHLGMIVLAAIVLVMLLRPRSLERLKLLEISGFKLEMLEKVKERQVEQANLLDGISLMLPLLLPETERKHLFNLDRGRTKGYKGNSVLRAELRRLRSIRLLRMRPGRYVGHMTSGMEFDLANYVELTDLGEQWVRRIKQIEKSDA
ncbi:hypothetical protein [Candidatus Thiosymbion oneisti]|uniref:hypothetical protein n=1 Tax=Candidatus Thiosymbion oneisti TaxID=589554 RepID=UPI00114CB974|nr:hypothetical protein [Candidatus Thiosymbion oneisti]